MPLLQVLPTFTAWNNMNNASPTGMTDPQTGQPYYAGGLNLGDYFDATEQEANTASYLTNGLLHAGRYRMVQVASNATAANVAVGKVGFMQPGTFVQAVTQQTAGSGMTVGASVTTSTTGGGATTQATIQVVVLTATTVQITVLTPGVGFTSTPTVTAPATGGTPPTFNVQMGVTVNQVTSSDIASLNLVRPVVFLNTITPGNYGFVQELGIATVLSAATTAQAINNNAIVTSSTGLMAASAATYSLLTIGSVLDVVASSTAITPFKILLNGPVVQD